MPRGRPRAFDREHALRIAVREFWERGFEPVSVAELTAAMGITPPSLYAAFGDKKTLFREAVDHYRHTDGAFFGAALADGSTVRDGVAAALRAAAVQYTRADRPAGCLVINAAVNCTPASADIAALLCAERAANLAALRTRLEADGHPPAEAATLATYVGVVLQGMSHHARDGATTDDLLAVADTAMRAWPPRRP